MNIDDYGLRDLGYKGDFFTWKRKNSSITFKRERIDTFLGDMKQL